MEYEQMIDNVFEKLFSRKIYANVSQGDQPDNHGSKLTGKFN